MGDRAGDLRAGSGHKRYAATSDLCADAELKALGGALGDPKSPEGEHREHDAVDLASCFMELERAGEEQSYIVRIHYRLHKKTDPAAEFEVYATDPGYLESDHVELRTERLDGLGEEAIETVADNGSGMTTWVRDGGAVLSLTVSTAYQQYGIAKDSPNYMPQLDVSATRELVKADLADLMAALQK